MRTRNAAAAARTLSALAARAPPPDKLARPRLVAIGRASRGKPPAHNGRPRRAARQLSTRRTCSGAGGGRSHNGLAATSWRARNRSSLWRPPASHLDVLPLAGTDLMVFARRRHARPPGHFQGAGFELFRPPGASLRSTRPINQAAVRARPKWRLGGRGDKRRVTNGPKELGRRRCLTRTGQIGVEICRLASQPAVNQTPPDDAVGRRRHKCNLIATSWPVANGRSLSN